MAHVRGIWLVAAPLTETVDQSQARRMFHGPLRPRRDVGEQTPARAVFIAVRAFVGAVMARVEPQTCDHDEHVWLREGGRVDRDPGAWAGIAPAHIVLRERVLLHDFAQ